ncbi:MAG: nicotinate-nucleotide--dimethylbenzimidazole phosphoribosyltransferase [Magnetococcales bacterium]|nr:nicotinate-nucleotide--dimethylbenzimidazole phosphoribosyltransferase [Magnetococcales bacterium]
MSTAWIKQPILPVSEAAKNQARKRLSKMAKPLGSLGVLEDALIRLAGMQNSPTPSVDIARIVVFAADHGVVEAASYQGASPYSQVSTLQRVKTVLSGRGAVSIMARHLGFEMEVVNAGMAEKIAELPGLINCSAGRGTRNFQVGPAMTEEQLVMALLAGQEAVERASQGGVQIFVGGEIAIGKSISAAAITSALLGISPDTISGPGSGGSPEGMAQKAKIIETALALHLPTIKQPLQALRALGGFEAAALCGAFIACGQRGIPAIVDGFVAATAALVAVSIHPPLREWLLFGHRSAEPGQLSLLRAISGQPILHLDMHLGEGTGATAALSLLRMACVIHKEMILIDELES